MIRRWLVLLVLVLALALLGGGVYWSWHSWPDRQKALARQALAADSPARAEDLLRPVLQSHPEDLSAQTLLVQALRRRGHFKDAEIALKRAIALGLPEAEGRREFALVLAAEGNYPPEAQGILQKVVRDYPDDPEVLQAIAGAYAAQGHWREAEPLFDHLLELQPDQDDIRFRRGTVRMRRAHFAEACDDFRRVLANHPKHFPARLHLANSLLGDAQMNEAEAELLLCHQMRPDRADPLVGLAHCALEHNDLTSTEKLLRQAAGLQPDLPLVLQELANLYIRRQRPDMALPWLRRLVALNPDAKQPHLQLAQILRAQGNLEESREHERRYQELDRREEAAQGIRRGM